MREPPLRIAPVTAGAPAIYILLSFSCTIGLKPSSETISTASGLILFRNLSESACVQLTVDSNATDFPGRRLM